MDALTRAVVHAKDFYQNDSLEWSNVIEATLEIVTPEDIEAFRELCIEEEYNLNYDSFDETHVEPSKATLNRRMAPTTGGNTTGNSETEGILTHTRGSLLSICGNATSMTGLAVVLKS